jgi:hypothetical protein
MYTPYRAVLVFIIAFVTFALLQELGKSTTASAIAGLLAFCVTFLIEVQVDRIHLLLVEISKSRKE